VTGYDGWKGITERARYNQCTSNRVRANELRSHCVCKGRRRQVGSRWRQRLEGAISPAAAAASGASEREVDMRQSRESERGSQCWPCLGLQRKTTFPRPDALLARPSPSPSIHPSPSSAPPPLPLPRTPTALEYAHPPLSRRPPTRPAPARPPRGPASKPRAGGCSPAMGMGRGRMQCLLG
jgi:hypothetical protein